MWTVEELRDAVDPKTRQVGKAHEIEFWRVFMGSDRCASVWCDAIPNPELDKDIYSLVRSLAWAYEANEKTLDILDIGSGPVSMLTNAFHGLQVNLKAADPLADEYEKLWEDKTRRRQVVRPVSVAGENLVQQFGNNSFDVTHIRNAIDHAVHPMAVVEQMIGITRKAGLVIIHGFENEAKAENWAGFHQWNMRIVNGELEIEGNVGQKYGVLKTFKDQLKFISAYTKPLPGGKYWSTLIAAIL